MCVCRSPPLYYRTGSRALRALLQIFGLMADDASAVSAAATAAEHCGSAAAEHIDMEERTPLAELLSDQTGAAGSWDLKAFYSDINEYKSLSAGR